MRSQKQDIENAQIIFNILLFNVKEKVEIEKKTWKQRIIDSFGQNPIKCRKCGKEMELWDARYGTIYHIFDEWKTLKEVPDLSAKEKERVQVRRRNTLRRPERDKY